MIGVIILGETIIKLGENYCQPGSGFDFDVKINIYGNNLQLSFGREIIISYSDRTFIRSKILTLFQQPAVLLTAYLYK